MDVLMSAVPVGARRGCQLELTGDCELPDLGAGNQTRVLWKNKKYS